MNAYKLLTLIVVSVLIAILLTSALNSFMHVSDSALADTAPTVGAQHAAPFSNAPRTAPGKNYFPIIFLNSATAGGAWLLSGNAGTVDGADFLGTIDNVTFTIRVNQVVGWRLAPNGIFPPNVIGGYDGNSVYPGVYGVTIGGGGVNSQVNRVFDHFGTIGGGEGNVVGINDGNVSNQTNATVGGGGANTASNVYATVGGGGSNIASGASATVSGGNTNRATNLYAAVGGGLFNTASGNGAFVGGGGYDGSTVFGNQAAGNASTIGGGLENSIPVSGQYSTIGGGDHNSANDLFATVGGGVNNTASGMGAFVGGGGFNGTVSNGNTASGNASTVPGGFGNSATMAYTFAAGRRAKAVNQGAFVWGDSTDLDFSSTANDQFLIRANGGMGVNTNSPAANTLTIGGNGLQVGTSGTPFARIQSGISTLGQGISGVNTFTITFPSAFSVTPKVNVTPRAGGDYSDTFAVTVRNVSTTQFSVNVFRVDPPAGQGWGQFLQLDWSAWQ